MFFKLNPNARILTSLLLALTITHKLSAAGPAPVNLLSTAHFTILSGAAITTTGGGIINGDIGASPIAGSAIGVPCSQVNGIIYAVDASGPPCAVIDASLLTTAKGDLTTAYNDAAGRTPIPSGPNLNPGLIPGSGNIGGMNLAPGLYKFTTSALITGSDVTLTGGPDDVWIFQCGQDLQLASGIKVILAGGARAKNIFWQVGTSAVLGTSSVFEGTILADQAITMNTSSTLNGRALASSAGVTFNGTGAALPTAAQIGVQQPAGTNLTNNTGTNNFGSVAVGTNANLTFTITNSGNASLTGLGITIDGTDAAMFNVTTNPVSPVSANGSTTFTVRFTPTSAGQKVAALHIASNDPSNNPFTINLAGGSPLVVVGPQMGVQLPVGTNLTNNTGTNNFGSVAVGTNANLTFTITNSGNASLTGLGITIDGTDAAMFSVTTNPVAPLSASNSTTFTVRFTPTSAGQKVAALHIESNDPNNSPFTINLAGGSPLIVVGPQIGVQQPAGTNLTNNSGTNNFGSVGVGTNASLTFTITNSGNASLTGLGITIDGTDAALFSVTTNPVSPVSANGSTTFTVRFTPTSAGQKVAALHIASNDPNNSPFTINLAGGSPLVVVGPQMGVQLPVGTNLTNNSGTNNFGVVSVGTNANLTFTITNSGNASLTGLSITIDGTDAAMFNVTINPVSPVSANGSTTFTVRFTPTSAGQKVAALHITSNDPNNSPFTINLAGGSPLIVVGPQMGVQQPAGTNLTNNSGTNNFGSVGVGTNANLTFTITNSGNASLTGLGITIDGTDAAMFNVTTNPVSPVSANGSTTFTVRFTPTSAGQKIAALHITSNDPSNNPFNVNLGGSGIVVPFIASTNLVAGTSPITLNRQTGLFEQTLHVTNTSLNTIAAVRVLIQNLTADVQVYNASGSLSGTPFVQYNVPLAPAASVDFLIEYYRANRQAIPQPVFIVQETTPTSLSAAGPVMAIDRNVQLQSGRFLIEFSAIPGGHYAVQYSSDRLTWKNAGPTLTAPANRVQWYDDGPPKTDSKPATTGSRFYRVLVLP